MLCDTLRAWYSSVKQELIKTGGAKSKYNGAIFYWHNGSKLEGILSSHVENFFWAGTSWFYAHDIDHLRKKFVISKEETVMFKYLELQIQQSKNGIEIYQKDYIQEDEAIKIDNPSQKDCILLPHETQQLRRVASQLNWVSTQARPDMAYAATIVSGSIKDARVRDLIVTNKFIKFLKSRDVVLSFTKIDYLKSSSLISFSDVTFANLIYSGSQGSLIIFLDGSNDKYMPLAWKPRKLKRVVKGTLTAETVALQEAMSNQ